MKKYEYKTVSVDAKGFTGGKVDFVEFDTALNTMGQQGWELVESVSSNQAYGSTRYIVCVFKRDVSE